MDLAMDLAMDNSFQTLIFAAMRAAIMKNDRENTAKLATTWPEQWMELLERTRCPGVRVYNDYQLNDFDMVSIPGED